MKYTEKIEKITAGWSYAVGDLWVSLIGNKPFNVDTMKDIHNIWVDIESDDGKGSAAPQVGEHKSSGPLTYQQEKLGKKREVVIHLRVPDGHQDAFYKAVRDALKKDFKVTKLKSWKTPQTQA